MLWDDKRPAVGGEARAETAEAVQERGEAPFILKARIPKWPPTRRSPQEGIDEPQQSTLYIHYQGGGRRRTAPAAP